MIGLPKLAGQADENSRKKVQNVVTDSSELFRDDKNRRNGFALRNIQIQRADRIDRLLLI